MHRTRLAPRICHRAAVVTTSGEIFSADVDFASTPKAEMHGEDKGAFMKIKKTGVKGGKVVWGS